MKSTILALAALGLLASAAHSAPVQCDRGAVFQTCNGAANNEKAPAKAKKANNGGTGGQTGGTGGSTGGTSGGDDHGSKDKPHGGRQNNGFGNGDQDAPGNSGSHNNAENSGHQNHHGKH